MRRAHMNGVYPAIYGAVWKSGSGDTAHVHFVSPWVPFVVGEPLFVRSSFTAASATPSNVSHAVRRVTEPGGSPPRQASARTRTPRAAAPLRPPGRSTHCSRYRAAPRPSRRRARAGAAGGPWYPCPAAPTCATAHAAAGRGDVRRGGHPDRRRPPGKHRPDPGVVHLRAQARRQPRRAVLRRFTRSTAWTGSRSSGTGRTSRR